MKKLVAVVFFLAGLPCAGQQGTTCELTGLVTSSGQALAGVSVTISSAALQSRRTTVTGENGGYLFTLLPPADYVASFARDGFTPVQVRIHASLAETARADVELTAAPVREEIIVKPASAPVSEDATTAEHFGAAFLQSVPGARDIRAATQLSSNTNTLGLRNGLIIAGAPSWDSLYLIDGVSASEYLTGQPHDVVLEDAIQEVVVVSGAISAEFGRFTGGVVSTVTKSGGNEFSGSIRGTLTNPAWTVRTPWPAQPDAASHTNAGFEATLGGYIFKDRLWFFAASRSAQSTVNRFTTQTNLPYPSTAHDQRWQVKLTDQITARNAAVLSYSDARLEENNVLDTRLGSNVFDLSSLIADRVQPTRLFSTTYDSILGTNTAAELQYSQKRYALQGNGGLSRDRIAGTVIVATGGNMNAPFGCGICGPDERDSRSGSAKVSSYWNTRWGNHTADAGGAVFHERRTNAGTRSSSEFNIQMGRSPLIDDDHQAYPVFGPQTRIIWTQPFPGDVGSDLNTASAYVSDRWDIRRATFDLGLRYDRNHAVDAAGRLISNDGAFSPRLSGSWNLGQTGAQRLQASFGRYTSRILEGGGANQQIGTFNQFGWPYRGDPINAGGTLLPTAAALARLFKWFDSVGGVQNRSFLRGFTSPYTSEFRGSLKSPSVDERSIGYSLRSQNAFIRADLVARDWHNFYAARLDKTTGQRIDESGNPADIAWIVNDNSETIRRYRAVELQGSWRYGKENFGGGYTWSRLWGNDDEEDFTTSTQPRNLPLTLWYPELLGYPQRRPIGYLRQDERHRARLWITRDDGPLTAAIVQRVDSGRPYSAAAGISISNVVPLPPYYTASQLGATSLYYFSKRAAFRTDNVFSTDVAVQYQIPVGSVHMLAKADVLNLFNNAAVFAPNTDVNTFINSSELVAFNPFTQVPVAGVNYALGRNFGNPTGPESYQTPRTFQVAFGVRF